MATFPVYSDLPDFLANANANIETATLIGGNTTLSGNAALGATSLGLTSATGFPGAGTFTAYILDGLNSERVTASVSGSNLTVPAGTLAAHSAGVSVSSAGTAGNLADAIIRASRAIENHCGQGTGGGSERSLYALTRTEKANGPSTRVAIDPDGNVIFRPWRWPIISLSAFALQCGAGAAVSLDTGSAAIPTDGRLVLIPAPGELVNRAETFVASWTYLAGACGTGPSPGVPDDIRQASHLLIADILAQRQNPYGLAEQTQGKLHRVHRRGGDDWATALRERAYELLAPYTRENA